MTIDPQEINRLAQAGGKIPALKYIRTNNPAGDPGLREAQQIYADAETDETRAILDERYAVRQDLERRAIALGCSFNYYANASTSDLKAQVEKLEQARAARSS